MSVSIPSTSSQAWTDPMYRWTSTNQATSLPFYTPGKKRNAHGLPSIAAAAAQAANKRHRAGAYNYFSDHQESVGRDTPTMPQSMVVFTCQHEKKIQDIRAEEYARVANDPEKNQLYAPAGTSPNIHQLKKGNLVFTTHDSLTNLSARTTITALGTVSVSDNVNGLLASKKIQFVGCVESESDSNDGTGDTACTISIAGTITTVNTGPINLYPGQKCYAIPYPTMVDAGNGRVLPFVLPHGQPNDKFLLTTIGVTDDVVFVLLRAARTDIESIIVGIENDRTITLPQARVLKFQQLMGNYAVRKLGQFVMADESLLTDYVLMHGLRIILQRWLTGYEAWRGTNAQVDDGWNALQTIVVLGFRALKIFVRDRDEIVTNFYTAVSVPNATDTPSLQIGKLDEDKYNWNLGTQNATDEPDRLKTVWNIIRLLDQMTDVAREEVQAFLDRMYVGRVMNFSKPGHPLDVLMGAK